jgi:hypothetical protein
MADHIHAEFEIKLNSISDFTLFKAASISPRSPASSSYPTSTSYTSSTCTAIRLPPPTIRPPLPPSLPLPPPPREPSPVDSELEYMDEMRQFELYLQEEKVFTVGEQRMLGETMMKIIKQACTVRGLENLTKEDAMLSKIPLGHYYRIQKAAGGLKRGIGEGRHIGSSLILPRSARDVRS